MSLDEELGEALGQQAIANVGRREPRRVECGKQRGRGRAILVEIVDGRLQVALPPSDLRLDEIHFALRGQRNRIGVVRVLLNGEMLGLVVDADGDASRLVAHRHA